MSFPITLSSQKQQFAAPAEQSLLDAAEAAGWLLPHGCRHGGCGICKCHLLAGEVEHIGDSSALTEEDRAAGVILPCTARARSALTLEVPRARRGGLPPVQNLACRISELTELSPEVIRMRVQLPASAKFSWFAGQYINFILPDEQRRSFSIANAPGNGGQELELHIGRSPGGLFTGQVFNTMKVRDTLRLEGPFGDFYLRAGDKPLVLVAGGTGFAPVKAIIEQLIAEGSQRPVWLYRGARHRDGLYLDEFVTQWQQSLQNFSYIPVLSAAGDDDSWTGRRGLIHHAVMADLPDLSGFDVYVCGRPIMVAAARQDFLLQCNLPETAFFSDAFSFASTPNLAASS